jgi:phage baseplate assembly protein W
MTVDERIYGSDLFLENGDLQISNTGDLQHIDSLNNVGQAMKNALTTEIGTLFYSPSYGVNLLAIIGNKNISIVQTRLINEVTKILKSDYRVKTIDQLLVEQDSNNPTQINITIRVTPINSMDSINISLSYPFNGISLPITSIVSENDISTTALSVSTLYSIYSINGVWLSSDIQKVGINYYTGGFINYNNVSLGTALPSRNTKVIIDYTTLNVINSKQIRQIFSEQIFCNDGITMTTLYNIFDVAGIWNSVDTEKLFNLINTIKFSNKNIEFLSPVTAGNIYFIDYSTKDDIK